MFIGERLQSIETMWNFVIFVVPDSTNIESDVVLFSSVEMR